MAYARHAGQPAGTGVRPADTTKRRPRSAVRAAGKGSTALREGNGLVKLRDRASG